jgi:hypothetical protein
MGILVIFSRLGGRERVTKKRVLDQMIGLINTSVTISLNYN